MVVVAIAAACTSTSNDDSERATEQQGSVDVVESDALAFSAEDELRDVVRLALVEPVSYRPEEVSLNEQGAVILADLLYDGLTEVDGSSGELRPGLADRWTADATYTRWTFELGSGGQATAADVVATFNGLEDPGRPGAVQAVAKRIDAVVAVDEETVAIDLISPDAGFPWLVSGLPFSIIGPEGMESGRYKIDTTASSDDSDDLVLTPRSGDGPDVHVSWADDSTDAYGQLTLGEVDAAQVPPASVADAEMRFGAAFPSTTTTRFYVLNKDSALLATPGARRAVLAAVDQEGLPIEVVDASGIGTDGMVSSATLGAADVGCGATCEYEPEFAESAAAGLTSDQAVRVAYVGEEERPMAVAVVADLEAVGIEAEALAVTPDELAARIVSGDVELFSFGWIAPATSIDAVIPPLLSANSPTNVLKADSVTVAELLDEATMTEDDEARWSLLQRAHRQVLSDGLVMPVSESTSMLARAPHAAALALRSDGTLDLSGLD